MQGRWTDGGSGADESCWLHRHGTAVLRQRDEMTRWHGTERELGREVMDGCDSYSDSGVR